MHKHRVAIAGYGRRDHDGVIIGDEADMPEPHLIQQSIESGALTDL
jgi:hypothetical protein